MNLIRKQARGAISTVARQINKCPARPLSSARVCADSKPANLLETPLADLHESYGATMAPFAGYSMPILYEGQSHIESHNWVRTQAGLFDVSHMVQHYFSGPGATDFLESITPSDLKELKPSASTLSALLLPNGGILDDTMITKLSEAEYFVVTNAGRRDADLKYLEKELAKSDKEVTHAVLKGWGILALQGPRAAEVLQKLTPFNLQELKFGHAAHVPLLDGNPLLVTRSGYTGEDGFEISVAPYETLALAQLILMTSNSTVKLAGLAARDSLRLEAGMCLYGHDLDETTTPVEASLSWTIGKRRRAEGGFYGYDKIADQLKNGTERRRVGFTVTGPPAREGSKVFDQSGEKQIGIITSGSPSPTLKKNIAMGYIAKGFVKSGTKVLVEVRGKKRDAEVAKMPFVPPKYYR